MVYVRTISSKGIIASPRNQTTTSWRRSCFIWLRRHMHGIGAGMQIIDLLDGGPLIERDSRRPLNIHIMKMDPVTTQMSGPRTPQTGSRLRLSLHSYLSTVVAWETVSLATNILDSWRHHPYSGHLVDSFRVQSSRFQILPRGRRGFGVDRSCESGRSFGPKAQILGCCNVTVTLIIELRGRTTFTLNR
jgi:hypothetical protein